MRSTENLHHPQNKVLLEAVVRYVCSRHQLNYADFEQAQTDQMTLDVTLKFKGVNLPGKFQTPFEEIKRLLDDPFRGPVIRAAVPEFAKPVERILMLMQQMHNPYTIRVKRSEIDNLIRN